MKYVFLVTVATFAFLVACGKKDKKNGEQGKTTGQAECTEKDKTSEKCVKAAEDAKLAQQKGEIPVQTPREATGAKSTEAKTSYDTIPNIMDEELKKDSKMSLVLTNQTALLANIKINSENNLDTKTKIFCGDLADAEKLIKEAAVADPDELKDALASVFLFKDSSIVVDLNVAKGDKTGDKNKFYMLTCNSDSKADPAKYFGEKADKAFNAQNLNVGQQIFEMITLNGKKETGILASIECSNDDQILDERVKVLGKDKSKKALNRIRLRKGSSILVYRAYEFKDAEKKLNEMGTDKQKEHKYSVISCALPKS